MKSAVQSRRKSQKIWFMGIVLYGTGIVLQAVTGYPFLTSVVIIGGAAVFYTCIGGIKAVIWTDVFQSIIIFCGIFAVIIKGVMVIGGVSRVFEICLDNHRLNFFDFNPDPTVRHTFWSLVVGSIPYHLHFSFKQSAHQRFSSTPTVKSGQRVLVIAVVGVVLMDSLIAIQGFVAFAYFYHKGCDPLESRAISTPNQIMPYLVMEIFQNLPGVPGLYVACIISAALSSVSSCLSSLSAMTLEGIVKPFANVVTEYRVTLVAKALVIAYGVCGLAVSYLVASTGTIISQISSTLVGSANAPICGLFLLGLLFPSSNWKGAIFGTSMAFAISVWIGIGSSFSANKATTPWLPPAPTSNCPVVNITSPLEQDNGSDVLVDMTTAMTLEVLADMTTVMTAAINNTEP